jgi:DNA-binding response OmpR family regulator
VAQSKVLIVEDEAFLRDLYVDTLSPEGYEVSTAIDGEDALTKIQQQKWDIILLDIILPKKSAFQILETLSTDPNNKNVGTPILMLTNLDSDFDIKRALSLGGTGYLIKSQITPGDLVREVKNALEANKVVQANQPDQVPQAPVPIV